MAKSFHQSQGPLLLLKKDPPYHWEIIFWWGNHFDKRHIYIYIYILTKDTHIYIYIYIKRAPLCFVLQKLSFKCHHPILTTEIFIIFFVQLETLKDTFSNPMAISETKLSPACHYPSSTNDGVLYLCEWLSLWKNLVFLSHASNHFLYKNLIEVLHSSFKWLMAFSWSFDVSVCISLSNSPTPPVWLLSSQASWFLKS